MLDRREFTAVLLIIGTCIGAGMIALPATLAPLGFKNTLILLGSGWLFTCFSGFLMLEILLWLPENKSYISMIQHTLGKKIAIAGGILSLILFYSMLTAYTTIGGKLIENICIDYFGYLPSEAMHNGAWLGFYALVIYAGMQFSAQVNRILVFGLLTSFSLLLAMTISNVDPSLLQHEGNWEFIWSALPIVITSFGFQFIIPTVRRYLYSQPTSIVKAITLGTFIPLIVYALWIYITFGIIPWMGQASLHSISLAREPSVTLIDTIVQQLGNEWIYPVIRFFIFFAISTSLISMSLSTVDIIADAFKIERDAFGNLLLILLAFIPPYFYSLFYPESLSSILGYAAVLIVLLYGILPVFMTWAGRYHYWQGNVKYTAWGGKFILILVAVLSLATAFSEIASNLHWMPRW